MARAAKLGALTVLSAGVENILDGKYARCVERHRVRALEELPRLLEDVAASDRSRTLDLLGHTRGNAKLLRLGTTTIDMTVPSVARVFHAIAASGVLARKQIVAVRLIGCGTAVMPAAQLTLRLLARSLGVPVFGTRKSIRKNHYDAAGFDPLFACLLIESRQLPNPPQPLA